VAGQGLHTLDLASLASTESVGSTERRLGANADADPLGRHNGRQDIALNLNEPFVLQSLAMLMDLFR
jgi:hypothetical protein